MVTFDSPILICAVRRRVVLRDTTWQCCAEAHQCTAGKCPYESAFQCHEGRGEVLPPGGTRNDEAGMR
ncbi:MAG: hypothetical protein OET44_00860 [Gammaproteobacteria bacterium]|nr:hypothetical protein [Gammaproteobacteria bacterium]